VQPPLFLTPTKRPPKVALVHDYLVQDGGAERVLAVFQEMFPTAPIYTLFYDADRAHPGFRGADIRTSILQKWPFVRGREEWTLPFMPMAVEHLDLTGYDLVISSSSSFAKGVIVAPHAKHVCYLHTPTRFLWQDRMSYVNDLPQPRFIKNLIPPVLHRLRMWDRLAAERPDAVITNSVTSRRRISRYYGRDAQVVHPPVDVWSIPFMSQEERPMAAPSYWLTGGRLVGYKRFDLTVRAFAKLDLPLKVFGTGPELRRLKRIAGPQTEFLGRIADDQKRDLYAGAIGFIHPQIEDFGITAVEAMAAGKPVIAYGEGGAAETVLNGVTGRVIETQAWEDIGDAVIRWDASRYDPRAIRAHAETFSKERFKERFGRMVEEVLQS
jgi:glycosyltransferase involved in cell wall biosynthesis